MELKPQQRLRRLWRESLVPHWRDYRWPVIGVLGLAAFLLGWWGFRAYFITLGEPRSPWDLLYLSLQLFTLESGSVSGPVGWQLQVARLLAPAVAIYVAGSALAVIFREQIQLFRIRFSSGHVLICGLGRKGLLLARAFRDRGDKVVVIEKDEGNDMVKPCREDGAIVVLGDARDRQLLRSLRVQRASAVFAVCGNDGVNAEVAVHTRELASSQEGGGLSALIHIVDPRLCTLLRMRGLSAGTEDFFRLEYFNVFESGARALLSEHAPFDEEGEAEAELPHILLVGLGKFGETLLVQMARGWKNTYRKTGSRLRITIVDKVAEDRKESLTFRYPKLESVCALAAVQLDVGSPEFEEGSFLFAEDGRCDVSYVCVCLDEDSSALSAALTLHHRLKGHTIPIVVRMRHEAGLGTLLGAMAGSQFENLHAFGLLDRTCKPDLLFAGTHEVLARAFHEHYVQQRQEEEEEEKGEGPSLEADLAMADWEELSEDYKYSNRHQAGHIGEKLRAIDCVLAPLTDLYAEDFPFSAEEVELLARMEHERFVDERRSRGWSEGRRDPGARTSPYLGSWEDLPPKIQDRDREAIRALPRVLARAGFQIVRR